MPSRFHSGIQLDEKTRRQRVPLRAAGVVICNGGPADLDPHGADTHARTHARTLFSCGNIACALAPCSQ
jgi:hypothetical protein